MKKYRYLINGVAYAWQSCEGVSLAKLEAIAQRFNKWGYNWQIEFN